MVPARFESGPGRLVPGADPSRPVVRVIYRDREGRRITLDQQPSDTPSDSITGEHRVSINGLMPGDTLVTTSPDGLTRIRWIAQRKFWLSLSGRVEVDSLRALVGRIR